MHRCGKKFLVFYLKQLFIKTFLRLFIYKYYFPPLLGRFIGPLISKNTPLMSFSLLQKPPTRDLTKKQKVRNVRN